MIEVPRAALTADEIARHADFFSFGTNDLTQTTLAFSRDDAEGKFLPHYLEDGVLRATRSRRSTDGVGAADRDRDRRAAARREAGPQARHLRRARRRPGVGRVLPPRRPRLRLVLAVPRAHRAAGRRPGGARRGSAADEPIDVAFTPGDAGRLQRGRGGRRAARDDDDHHALDSGYRRVLACGDLDEARELAAKVNGGAVLAGERQCVKPRGSTWATRRASSRAPPLGDDARPHDDQRHPRDRHRRGARRGGGSSAASPTCRPAPPRSAAHARDGGRRRAGPVRRRAGRFAMDDAYTAGR